MHRATSADSSSPPPEDGGRRVDAVVDESQGRSEFEWVRTLGTAFIVAWTLALLLVTASLMVGHWVSLPHPKNGESFLVVGRAVSHRGDVDAQAFHFLYGDCPCSRRVLEKLLQRSPLEKAAETIVLIGDDPAMETRARDRGYLLDVVAPTELKTRYGVESAPLLVVTNSEGSIVYSGGYTSRKQGLEIHDRELIQSVLDGDSVEHLPVYGCAVSKELQSIMDPLGLKYTKE